MARSQALPLISVLLGLLCLAGCATGPKLEEVIAAVAGPPAGQARIYFYRPIDAFLIARTTDYVVNDLRVGRAISGATFFRDALPGDYRIHTVDDTKSVVHLRLDPGDIAYVRAQSQRKPGGYGVGVIQALPEVGARESARLVFSDGLEIDEDPGYLLPEADQRHDR